MSFTSDGYLWTATDGLQKGELPCKGVVTPSALLSKAVGVDYDVIVIGAGYAGLIAARDIAISKCSVLLIEARDRIGGRTFTVDVDGYPFEMGGTWVTHFMGHLLSEMMRYGVDKDIMITHQSGFQNDYYTINVPGVSPRKLPHSEASDLIKRLWNIFVDVDGVSCRSICPLPHMQLGNLEVSDSTVKEWDKLSCKDRFDQVKSGLNTEEAGLLYALLLHLSGNTLEHSSFWDVVRSHALFAHNPDNFDDVWFKYKLRKGQSSFARKIFDDAVECGLEYSFSTTVTHISQSLHSDTTRIEVKTCENSFYAKRVICTVPLNVLHDLTFDPPLSRLRQEAIQKGHTNYLIKVHAQVESDGLASWAGMRWPNDLLFGHGDGVLPSGRAHVTAFGDHQGGKFVPEKDPQRVINAFANLHYMEVAKLLFHNWNTDRYSQAGPAWLPPSFMTEYLEELQSRHGNVSFASADWAHGWRGSIDGAMEQGRLAASEVNRELNTNKRSRNQVL